MIYTYDEDGNIVAEEPIVLSFLSGEDFLKQIDFWRQEKKYSYAMLGKIIGLHKCTISHIFAGSKGLTLENLVKLLRIFGYRLAIEEIVNNVPDGYCPGDDEINEMDDYFDIKDYIKVYKSRKFKGTYEEYKEKVVSGEFDYIIENK